MNLRIVAVIFWTSLLAIFGFSSFCRAQEKSVPKVSYHKTLLDRLLEDIGSNPQNFPRLYRYKGQVSYQFREKSAWPAYIDRGTWEDLDSHEKKDFYIMIFDKKLLEVLTPHELLSVAAHELGHLANGDLCGWPKYIFKKAVLILSFGFFDRTTHLAMQKRADRFAVQVLENYNLDPNLLLYAIKKIHENALSMGFTEVTNEPEKRLKKKRLEKLDDVLNEKRRKKSLSGKNYRKIDADKCRLFILINSGILLPLCELHWCTTT